MRKCADVTTKHLATISLENVRAHQDTVVQLVVSCAPLVNLEQIAKGVANVAPLPSATPLQEIAIAKRAILDMTANLVQLTEN